MGRRKIPLDLPSEITHETYKRLYANSAAANPGPILVPAFGDRAAQSPLRPAELVYLTDPMGRPDPAPELWSCIERIVELAQTDVAAAGRLLLTTTQAALRSHHLAALSREWPKTVSVKEIFWRRRAVRILREVFGAAREGGITPQQVSRIQYLLASIEIREPRSTDDNIQAPDDPTSPLLVITAIAASIGILPRPKTWLRLIRSNKELNALVDLVRVQPIEAGRRPKIGAGGTRVATAELKRRIQAADGKQIPLMQPITLIIND
jgi:hypothetical protein